MRAAPKVMSTPTGTMMPTELASDGTHKKIATIKISGTIAILKFLLIYTTARPPNSAGKILSNAGFKAGESNTGVRSDSANTPMIGNGIHR